MRHAALLLALLASPLAADEPGDDVLVIRAARVITAAGPELAPGTIVVRGGKVEAVGRRVDTPPGARVLDLGGATVMPGLVSPRSRFGLGASYDRGGNHADLSAAGEVDPSQDRFRPLLRAGYVCAGLVPAGGGIPGKAVGLRPGDGARDELLVPGAGYLRVRFTSLPGDKVTLREALQAAKLAIEREENARKAWEEKQKQAAAAPQPGTPAPVASPAATTAPVASPAAAAFEPPAVAAELKPFMALLRGKDAPRVVVEIARASDLLHLEEVWTRVPAATRPAAWVLEAGGFSDLQLIVEKLGKEKALVVCPPRLTTDPHTRNRRNLPLELHKAGARVALLPWDDSAAGHARALEALALLVRDGLPRDAALAGMTRVAAAVLGLSDQGSIEAGKRADLLVLDGDPLLPGTRVERVLLAGQEAWRRGEEELDEGE